MSTIFRFALVQAPHKWKKNLCDIHMGLAKIPMEVFMCFALLKNIYIHCFEGKKGGSKYKNKSQQNVFFTVLQTLDTHSLGTVHVHRCRARLADTRLRDEHTEEYAAGCMNSSRAGVNPKTILKSCFLSTNFMFLQFFPSLVAFYIHLFFFLFSFIHAGFSHSDAFWLNVNAYKQIKRIIKHSILSAPFS